MDQLRLNAVDEDDLAILSAHSQDAVVRTADCQFFPAEHRFLMPMNRFVWEKAASRGRAGLFSRGPEHERRRTVLRFDRVRRVQRNAATPLGGAEEVLALLALRFTATEAPSGLIELVFAGGSAIRLDVECIEAQLTDLGAAWSTANRPDHETPAA